MSNGNETQTTEYMDYVELGALVTEDTQTWDGQGGTGPNPGTYEFECIEAKQDPPKGPGKAPAVNVQFIVVSEGEEKGKKMRGWYYMTEKAIPRLLHMLNAAGVPLDERNGFSVAALVGTRIMATVVEESYLDKPNPMTGERATKTSRKLQQETAVPKKAAAPKGPAQGRPAAAPAAARR